MSNQLNLELLGEDKNKDQIIRAMRIKINNRSYDAPLIINHQTEVKKAQRIQLESNFYSYNCPAFNCNLCKRATYDKIQKAFSTLINMNKDRMVNFVYQRKPEAIIDQNTLRQIHNLQINSESPFLCTCEKNINQTEVEFEQELYAVIDNNDKIPVTTLHLGMDSSEIFEKKLQIIADNSKKIKRIDINHKSIQPTTIQNWLKLLRFMNKKSNLFWYNFTCISDRYLLNKNELSHLSGLTPLVLLGANSVGLAQKFSHNKNKNIFEFDRDTHYFLKSKIIQTRPEQYEDTWILSVNNQIQEMNDAHQHILNKTFWSQYIPNKSGLFKFNNTIQQRMP